MKFVFAFLYLLWLLPSSAQDTLVANMDSLKWKMYCFSFDTNLWKMKYGSDTVLPVRIKGYDPYPAVLGCNTYLLENRWMLFEDSVFAPVECSIEIKKIEIGGDTIDFILGFIRGDAADRYTERTLCTGHAGISYEKKFKVYFPILGMADFDVELDYFKSYWEKTERKFIKYLQQYCGYLDPWLKNELIKRKIDSPAIQCCGSYL